jgi:hypothetical protein
MTTRNKANGGVAANANVADFGADACLELMMRCRLELCLEHNDEMLFRTLS